MALSPQATAFLESMDAGLAKRWARAAGSPARHGGRGNGPANPNVPSPFPTRSKGGFARDFAKLKPSSVARHAPKRNPKANEHTPMTEGPVAFQPGSHPLPGGHSIGKPKEHTGAKGRDVRVAAAALVTKRGRR